MSLLSKNMREIIKLSQKKRFGSITLIRYDCDEPMVSTPSIISYSYGEIVSISQYDDTEKNYFPLNVSGRMIEFRPANEHLSVACYHPEERESVITAIHLHLLDLFGNSVKFIYTASNYKLLFPKLQNLSGCTDIYLKRNFTDMINLEKFLSSSPPVLKSLKMYIRFTSEPFSADSKLYQAESVKLDLHEPTVPDILRLYKGRQAFLRCETCQTSNLVDFVNRWKSGEGFEDLEYLNIDVFPHAAPDIEVRPILNSIGVRRIDTTKKPPTHSLPRVPQKVGSALKKYVSWLETPNTDPITSHVYVVRECDNRVASIQIRGRIFSFGVWDKTEEEFLGMME
ncbi:hypothetical protein B9Z55_000456 [Caenorhabditis nigoni]|nr:hypothetical protein B9Z55_000456 [Caenorhabditis nigoni]